SIDDRYSADEISSHAGDRWPSELVRDADDVLAVARRRRPHVLGVEEAQFIEGDLPAVARRLADDGIRVICAGLDADALGRPFGVMPQLMCDAEQLDKLAAVCMRCGADAHRSQLLVNGQPAPWTDGPLINVGGAETYE